MRAAPVVMVMVMVIGASAARADGDASAKALFDEGKALFAEGRYGEACARLEASFKLNPLSGTRGMLGACYEKVGKLASAWAAFRDVAQMAERQGNPDRAKAAREKVAELDPKLARIAIDTSAIAGVTGVRVTIDGLDYPLVSGGLATPLPIDGGPHALVVSAADHLTWKHTIDIQDGEQQKLAVPKLVEDHRARIAAQKQHDDAVRVARRRKRMATAFTAAGGASLVVASTFAVLARGAWLRAQDAGCDDSGTCPDPASARDVDRAALRADVATYAGGAGLLLVGAGVFVYLTSPKVGELRIAPTAGAGTAGVTIGGRF